MGGIEKVPEGDASECYIFLTKDEKLICRTRCLNPPGDVPRRWKLQDFVPRTQLPFLGDLPHCLLCPAAECSRDENEWGRFLSYLKKRNVVAVAKFEFREFYVLPPDEASNLSQAKIAFQKVKTCNASSGQKHCESGEARPLVQPMETSSRTQPHSVKPDGSLEKNYVRADPSYLQTLGQAHSGWIFGAIAELVDNSRDANATELDISIELIYFSKAGKTIPMLSVRDDGHGMTHQEIVRMTYFGHKQPGTNDPDRIGRFGVGFKTGAMRLGRDALVLTQTVDSRSIAFLSQSLNHGKDNLEIPVVSYYRKGQFMKLDTRFQSEETAKYNLKAIKEFSPFDKYMIGEKAGLFRDRNTGTQIYIWNLDEWGSDYSLEWHDGKAGGSSFNQGDIFIRSRRIRSRPGQISQKVLLDYSLRAYLQVIFLVPQMRMTVQGSLVKIPPLEKSLDKIHVENSTIMGKPVQLTLGCCQLDWEQMNCGIFLYWHGSLIEAYKRVGGMIHNGEIGRGIIGLMDVTDLMDGENGRVWVHNNKQGFLDCEPYARLEEWLGKVADEYWDNNFDQLQLKKGIQCQPDQEWVQCNKCRKWRTLSSDFDSKTLPLEWFCYMEPFNGHCETSEQKVDGLLITVSTKRTGYATAEDKSSQSTEKSTLNLEDGNGSLGLDENEESGSRPLKRMRKGLPRSCKK